MVGEACGHCSTQTHVADMCLKSSLHTQQHETRHLFIRRQGDECGPQARKHLKWRSNSTDCATQSSRRQAISVL